MIFRHKKGRHRSRPFILRRVKSLHYRVHFDESCRYNFNDWDQKDWNKLPGVKKHYLKPRRNSAMGAWRYSPKMDCVEVAYYYHTQNGSWVAVWQGTVDIGGSYTFRIDEPGWLILPWFGGNNRAPHEITFTVDFLTL